MTKLTLTMLLILGINAFGKSDFAANHKTNNLSNPSTEKALLPFSKASSALKVPKGKKKPLSKRNSNLKPKFKIEYSITFNSGHPRAACNGVGETCVTSSFDFVPCHIPCWGEGKECNHTVTITIEFGSIVDPTMPRYDGTMNTESDGFTGELLYMPARSIEVNAEQGQYINIPAQRCVSIDGTAQQIFSIKEISFSDTPLFENP